jgi:hypothetical protein
VKYTCNACTQDKFTELMEEPSIKKRKKMDDDNND